MEVIKIGNYIYERKSDGEFYVTKKEGSDNNPHLFKNKGIPEKYINSTFEDFFALSPNYKIEIDKIKKYITENNYIEKGIGLFISGPINSGKTFLTSLIEKELLKKGLNGFFYSFTEIIDSFSLSGWSLYSQSLKDLNFLCIDNFENILKEESYFLNRIKDIFNYYDLNNKIIIINSKKRLEDFYETPLREVVAILHRNIIPIYLMNSFEVDNEISL